MSACVREGLVTLQTPACVFFNPAQRLNRNLSVAVATVHARNRPKYHVLDAFSGSGARALRYATEIPNQQLSVVANDLQCEVVDVLKSNVSMNGLEERVRVRQGDARSACLEGSYDMIDIDPFGSCSSYMDDCFTGTVHDALVGITAADIRLGIQKNMAHACYGTYGYLPLRSGFAPEFTLRGILGCIERAATRQNRGIQPLMALHLGYYTRIFVLVKKRNKGAAARNQGYILACSACQNFTGLPLMTDSKVSTIGNNGNCNVCGGNMQLGGPIYTGPIHDKDFVSEVITELKAPNRHYEDTDAIVNLLKCVQSEISDAPLYYDTHEMSSILKIPAVARRELIHALVSLGYNAGDTHCSETSVKTNAPSEVVWDLLRCFRLQIGAANDQSPLVERIMKKSPNVKFNFGRSVGRKQSHGRSKLSLIKAAPGTKPRNS